MSTIYGIVIKSKGDFKIKEISDFIILNGFNIDSNDENTIWFLKKDKNIKNKRLLFAISNLGKILNIFTSNYLDISDTEERKFLRNLVDFIKKNHIIVRMTESFDKDESIQFVLTNDEKKGIFK